MNHSDLRGLAAVARLELRLILRNKYARYFIITGPALIFVLCSPLLGIPLAASEKTAAAYGLGLIFQYTYLMFAFGWNTEHADGLFGWPISPRIHVLARVAAAAVLGAVPALLLTAELSFFAPELRFVALSSYTMSIGITALPMLWFSISVPHRLEINLGAFQKIQSMNWRHQVGGFVFISALFFVAEHVDARTLVVASFLTGGTGIATLPATSSLVAGRLERRLPMLCERYRTA